MEENKTFKIDVEHMLKTKAPNKKVPKFLVRYLKRIVHQDEFNEVLQATSHLKNVEFVEAALDELEITTTVEGKENLPPQDGRYIFVSNHPLGGLDGMIIGMLIGREYEKPVRYIANDLLMFLKPMEDMFVPVNKFGPSMTRENARIMNEVYASDDSVVTFPSGICARKVKGKVCELDWKKNFISKAIEHKRDVVPMFFVGENSRFFYNLAKIRKFFRIKFNIEMMYLADEMYKQKGNHFTLKIGEPIPWQTFDRSKTHAEWAEWVRAISLGME